LPRAIISDVHANFEALNAVLEDLRGQGIGESEVYCLGDVIGYGASPRECMEACRGLALNLLGNHEEAVLFYPEDLSPTARRAAEWTRHELNSRRYPAERSEVLWDFLAGLEPSRREGDALYVHASPRHETRDYVFPSDAADAAKMQAIFSAIPRWGFHGHTHVPGVLLEGGTYLRPDDVNGRFLLRKEKAFIDVGSVGQPRDADTRASYVTVDGPEVTFRRVTYDVEGAMGRIRASGLPGKLAERLMAGK